jgi:5-bromo-4-chloroindolyl phosphate hydrolysis protein
MKTQFDFVHFKTSEEVFVDINISFLRPVAVDCFAYLFKRKNSKSKGMIKAVIVDQQSRIIQKNLCVSKRHVDYLWQKTVVWRFIHFMRHLIPCRNNLVRC